jgi:hypothetical protein
VQDAADEGAEGAILGGVQISGEDDLLGGFRAGDTILFGGTVWFHVQMMRPVTGDGVRSKISRLREIWGAGADFLGKRGHYLGFRSKEDKGFYVLERGAARLKRGPAGRRRSQEAVRTPETPRSFYSGEFRAVAHHASHP